MSTSRRWSMGLLTLATLLGLAVVGPATRADNLEDPVRLSLSRQDFLSRFSQSPNNLVPLDPFGARVFRERLFANGLRPPRVVPGVVLTAEQVTFRQAVFTSQFALRAQRLGGQAGGFSFNSEGSPIAPVAPVNLFNFFPAFRFGGVVPGQ